MTTPLEIHLVRHAESTFNADGLITGMLNPDLSPKGVEQAKELALKLDSDYDLLVSSTLLRAKKTLELATDFKKDNFIDFTGVGLKKGTTAGREIDIIYNPFLNEIQAGILSGKPKQWIEPFSEGNLDYMLGGGESYRQLGKRVLDTTRFLYNYAVDKNYRKILICTHAGPMRILYGTLGPCAPLYTAKQVLNLKFKNTEIVKLTCSDSSFNPPFLKLQ